MLAFHVNVADEVAGGLSVKVTGMVCGVFEAPVAVTVMVPLYVLAVRLFVLIDTITESVSVVVVPALVFVANHG